MLNSVQFRTSCTSAIDYADDIQIVITKWKKTTIVHKVHHKIKIFWESGFII